MSPAPMPETVSDVPPTEGAKLTLAEAFMPAILLALGIVGFTAFIIGLKRLRHRRAQLREAEPLRPGRPLKGSVMERLRQAPAAPPAAQTPGATAPAASAPAPAAPVILPPDTGADGRVVPEAVAELNHVVEAITEEVRHHPPAAPHQKGSAVPAASPEAAKTHAGPIGRPTPQPQPQPASAATVPVLPSALPAPKALPPAAMDAPPAPPPHTRP